MTVQDHARPNAAAAPDAGPDAVAAPDEFSERVPIARFGSYPDAKRGVDRLRVGGIPDRWITVAARGFGWTERVTLGRALGRGALAAGAFGAALGLLLWAVGLATSGVSALGLALAAAGLGAVSGAAAGALGHHLTRERPTVPETGQVTIDHFDVLVAPRYADKARGLFRNPRFNRRSA